MTRRLAPILLMCLLALTITGCESPPRENQAHDAADAYFAYDFHAARERLRRSAYTVNDEQTLLNTMRLGLAALADGDHDEAERTLGHAFELLSTAGLNEDRTTRSVMWHEGVKIWKGEPFEQALAYYYVAALYATMNDWENARAAAANSLFRLTDFGADQNAEALARREAERPGFLDDGYTATDTDFALGFIMQAIASERSGVPGGDALLQAALDIDPRLDTLVETLRDGTYDTLLLVDVGKGPEKVAFGPDQALVGFEPFQREPDRLEVAIDDTPATTAVAACDLNTMAIDHRWNNLEHVRQAKSAIGHALMAAGTVVAASGDAHHDDEKLLVGLGMLLGGALARENARGDTRHLEYLPASIHIVPLLLGNPRDVTLSIPGHPEATLVLPDLTPGTAAATSRRDGPRVVYVRLQTNDRTPPAWMTATTLRYGNDHTGVRPGDWPWILGGTDVSTPTRNVLNAYQAGGHLTDFSLNDLRRLYDAEGILLGSGREQRTDTPRNPSYRHILEGGRGLFTPAPDSLGYKRLMYTIHNRYVPRSALVRNAAAAIRVPPPDDAPPPDTGAPE